LGAVNLIKNDNKVCLEIYNQLYKYFEESLNSYPLDVNLTGIFFIDILRLLTGSTLRHREIQHGIVIDHPKLKENLPGWPHIGYGDLINGVDIETKIFGVELGLSEGVFKRKILSLLSNVISKKNFNSCFTRFDYEKFLVANSYKHRFNVSWINELQWEPSIPAITEQIKGLQCCIDKISDNSELPLDADIYVNLLDKHVRAIVKEKDHPRLDNLNLFVCGSGTELINRFVGACALQNNIPVINIAHGESFGLLDNPIFGIGEQLYSSAYLGYGNCYSDNVDNYLFSYPGEKRSNYISGSSPTINKIYNKSKSNHHNFHSNKIFYFPTSLRGTRHRYGPYQDCSDYEYLQWQKKLLEIFDNKLFIKGHPKEKYLYLFETVHDKYISKKFLDIIDDVDVFVFDYISTAFCYAAATNKPIIYFNIGIQNIEKEAYEAIKKRALTFDVTDEFDISYDEIVKQLMQMDIDHTVTESYSLNEDREDREKKLLHYIINNYLG